MSSDDADLARALRESLSMAEARMRPAEHVFPHFIGVSADAGGVPAFELAPLPFPAPGAPADASIPEVDGVDTALFPSPATRSLPRSICVRMTVGSLLNYNSRWCVVVYV